MHLLKKSYFYLVAAILFVVSAELLAPPAPAPRPLPPRSLGARTITNITEVPSIPPQSKVGPKVRVDELHCPTRTIKQGTPKGFASLGKTYTRPSELTISIDTRAVNEAAAVARREMQARIAKYPNNRQVLIEEAALDKAIATINSAMSEYQAALQKFLNEVGSFKLGTKGKELLQRSLEPKLSQLAEGAIPHTPFEPVFRKEVEVFRAKSKELIDDAARAIAEGSLRITASKVVAALEQAVESLRKVSQPLFLDKVAVANIARAYASASAALIRVKTLAKDNPSYDKAVNELQSSVAALINEQSATLNHLIEEAEYESKKMSTESNVKLALSETTIPPVNFSALINSILQLAKVLASEVDKAISLDFDFIVNVESEGLWEMDADETTTITCTTSTNTKTITKTTNSSTSTLPTTVITSTRTSTSTLPTTVITSTRTSTSTSTLPTTVITNTRTSSSSL